MEPSKTNKKTEIENNAYSCFATIYVKRLQNNDLYEINLLGEIKGYFSEEMYKNAFCDFAMIYADSSNYDILFDFGLIFEIKEYLFY